MQLSIFSYDSRTDAEINDFAKSLVEVSNMCFGATWSGVAFSVLVLTALVFPGDPRVVATLVFLAAKEAIQFCNYLVASECSSVNRLLTTLSWIHISFQPFFVNLFISAFSKKPQLYTVPLALCLAFAVANMFRLKELRGGSINVPCADKSPDSSICRKETCSISGKYHLAYGFELESSDSTFMPSNFTYYLLTFIPALIIGDYWIVAIHAAVMGFSWLLARHDMGEAGALWCLNTVWIVLWVIAHAVQGKGA